MLHCDDVRSELSAFLDRELPYWKMQVIRWHLYRCPACAREMAWLQQTDTLLRAVPPQVTSPELTERILHRAAKEQPHPRRLWIPHLPRRVRWREFMRRHALVPVFALLLLVAVGLSFLDHLDRSKPTGPLEPQVVRVDLIELPDQGYSLHE